MKLIFLCLLALLVSFLLTWFLRQYALKKHVLIDDPNQRSSHSLPTPRGGGIAIVLAFCSVFVLFEYTERPMFLFSVLGAGVLVAAVGFFDDLKSLSPRIRLVGHLLAAVLIISGLGGVPPIKIFGWHISETLFGYGLAVLAVVWMINLFNFMDGIDGIAAVQVISVCFGCALLALSQGYIDWIFLPILLMFATLGFALFNFPPASIFMGDAGSGFLGIMLAVLILQLGWVDARLFWVGIILHAVFIADATCTLFYRVFQGEKLYLAHRTHAYQIAAQKLNSHLVVTVLVGLINILWLLPLAGLMLFDWIELPATLVLAYVPIIAVVWYVKKQA